MYKTPFMKGTFLNSFKVRFMHLVSVIQSTSNWFPNTNCLISALLLNRIHTSNVPTTNLQHIIFLATFAYFLFYFTNNGKFKWFFKKSNTGGGSNCGWPCEVFLLLPELISRSLSFVFSVYSYTCRKCYTCTRGHTYHIICYR